MPLVRSAIMVSLLLVSVSASPVAQGPNTVYQNNPTLRTLSANNTWTVLPLDFEVVSALVAPKKLIPIAADAAKFPQGWPAGTHPVVVNGGFDVYIEQLGLSIPDSLMSANVRVPNVDQLGTGEPFNVAVADYIGGANGQILSPIVPAAVSTVEGTTVLPGEFDPDHETLKDLGDGEATFGVLFQIVPNVISGPGVAPPAISYTLHRSAASFVSAAGFQFLINQPLVLTSGMCQLNAYYFNETFAQPFIAEGTVQLDGYLNGLNGIPDSIAGTFTNGTAYSANAESVGYNAQDCQDAAAQNPTRSQ